MVEHDFQFVDNEENQLFFLTNYKAPNQRLIAIDFDAPAEANWKEIIPETDNV